MDRQRGFIGYLIAGAGFCIWMIVFGISNTFGLFYLPVVAEFNWQRADMIVAFSLGMFMMSVFALAAGWLTDRLGPRIVITVFGAFLGIAYLLMSQVTSLWQFHISYGVLAPIGMSVATTPVMATLARWFVKRRGLVTGWVQSGLGLGGLIFAPLTGWLIVQFGWRTAYAVLGGIALVGIVVPGLFMWRDPKVKGLQPYGAAALPDRAAPTSSGDTVLQDSGVGALVRIPQFWIILGIYAIFGFCRSTYTAHTAAHVQDMGYSLIDASHVMAVLMVSSIAGRIGMGWLADAVGNKKTFMMSYAATTASLIVVLFAGSLWGLYVYSFVFGFGWGAQAVLRFGLTADVFGLKNLGLIIGVLGIGEAIAAAVGAYSAGFFFDFFGSYRPAFLTGIILSLLGILLAALLRPSR